MINYERMKELISNEIVIWVVSYNEQTKRDETPNVIGLHLNYRYRVSNNDKGVLSHLFNHNVYSLEDCFENYEDANFYAKFKKASRTIQLDLDTYDEFLEHYKLGNIHYCKYVYSLDLGINYQLYLCLSIDKIRIVNPTIDDIIFEMDNTKENYLNACEVCRSLFYSQPIYSTKGEMKNERSNKK